MSGSVKRVLVINMDISSGIKKLISVLVICLAALLLTVVMVKNGAWPHGNDIFGHFFKINALYKQIEQGNLYPVYNENWYSGLELFRYWPPFSYYFYVLIMKFTGGDIYRAFPVFTFLVHAIGGCGFVLFGAKKERYVLGTLVGILFIFMPDNLKVFFTEGNIPRIVITMMLPWLFYFVTDFICDLNEKAIIGVDILCVLIVSTHIMIAAMVGLSTFVFAAIYSVVNKKYLNSFVLLVNMVLAYLSVGILLIPGLMGGLVSQSSGASQETSGIMWSRKAAESLNPALLVKNPTDFYFGVTIFFLVIVGVMVFRKTTLPFFGSGLVIFIGTTMIVLPIVSALPMSQAFWMTRFVPMGYTLILIGVMYWDNIKKGVLSILLILVAVDCFYAFTVHTEPYSDIYPTEEEIEQDYMLNKALDLTDCRIAFMDLSNIGSYTSYVITKDGRNVDSLFGWAYQGAYTINEIVELNEAFETGYYTYVFDRLIRYGCDTLVFKKNEVKTDYEGMIRAAQENGYTIVDETEKGLLMDYEYAGSYGTVFNYKNACIGVGSEYMSYLYPSFYKLRSNILDDYTFDELSKYEKIYITGPEYRDRDYCEAMLWALSDAGVKIYIDMNRLPIDKSTGRNSILGVVAQPIVFNDAFPVLEMADGTRFKLSVKDKEAFDEWRTVYFTNLKNVTRSARYSKTKQLAYLGSSPNKNITFIGLNLVYFQGCSVNQESQLYKFLDEVFEVGRDEVPERILVPVTKKVNGNDIEISSPRPGVLVPIANLDSFESFKTLGHESFVIASRGVTKIHTGYAYFKEGVICSVFGLVLTLFSIWFIIERYNIYGYGSGLVMARFENEENPVAGGDEEGESPEEKNTDGSFMDKSYQEDML